MIFLFVVGGVISSFLVFALLYLLFGVGKKFFDGVLGWHKPSKEYKTDGFPFKVHASTVERELNRIVREIGLKLIEG